MTPDERAIARHKREFFTKLVILACAVALQSALAWWLFL